MLRYIKRFIPASFKLKIRNLAREIVGPAGDLGEALSHDEHYAQLLDQKITSVERNLSIRVDEYTKLLDQKIIGAENDLRTLLDQTGSLLDQQLLQSASEISKLERLCTTLGTSLSELHNSDEETGIPLSLTDKEYIELEHRFHPDRTDSDYYSQALDFEGQNYDPALEIGCGDGKFLLHLQSRGITAEGTDTNLEYVKECQSKGLKVVGKDALEWLQSLPDNSARSIFAFHIVEHLTTNYLRRLFKEANRVLKAGGLFVVETPKISAAATLTEHYFTDPTHLLPRHHNQYVFLVEQAGFSTYNLADIVESNPDFKLSVTEIQNAAEKIDEDFSAELARNFDQIQQKLFIARDIRMIFENGEK